MFMQQFLNLNTRMTRKRVLSMLSASIRKEKHALCCIMKTEDGKRQETLSTLWDESYINPNIDEILAIHQSISGVLDKISQSQGILADKTEIIHNSA